MVRRGRVVFSVLVGVLLGLVVGCGDANGPSRTLTVFAAASLTEAFDELGAAFETASPDTDVRLVYASSSELAAQIASGAAADVFASADRTNLGNVALAANREPRIFATNSLVIAVPAGNPAGIESIADLERPGLVLVTCAAEVPCGRYTEAMFAKAGVTPSPKSRENNVRAVMTKVTLGEADAAVVYATDLLAARSKANGIAIPAELNVVADYPIAVTSGAKNPADSDAFIDFVLSPRGQSILASHGFLAP
jgi:molybdate transport system substrate-binding protein